ncbi:MAG: BamA/TamA family outer membrane protein [Sulfurospirillum sp.]
MKRKIILFFVLVLFSYAEVLPIRFSGNRMIDTRELYTALDLYKPYFYEFWKKEPMLEAETLPLAKDRLKNFYKSKGFYHTIVTDKVDREDIKIVIKEGKPILIQSISILSKFDLSSYIHFKKGEIFSAKEFEESKKNIKRFYKKKGYCKVNLDAKAWIDIEKNIAYLAYDIKRNSLCRFGDIKIETPGDIDGKIVKSLLYFKKNDLYSLDKINDTYKNFYAHEGIASVIIKTDIQNSDVVDTDINITEAGKPIRFQIGAGINSDEGLEATLGIKNRNFMGNLKTLGFSTKYTGLKQSASVNFDMPLVDKNSFGAGLKFSNEKFLGFKEQKFLETLFLKHRNSQIILQSSLIFDFSKIYGSDDLQVYPNGNFFFSSPKFSAIYDTRDDILEPTKGYFIKAEVMGSLKSFFSNASYYKYSLEGGYIIPVLPYIIALRVNFGSLHTMSGDLPASYRFYAGGMNSNRAYAYRKLGPKNPSGDPLGLNSVLEITAEYRFPIYGDFRGVLFSDNSYIGQSDMPDFTKGYNTLGFGLRYKTPIGPIAFDLGFDTANPSKQYAFHFRIGELF